MLFQRFRPAGAIRKFLSHYGALFTRQSNFSENHFGKAEGAVVEWASFDPGNEAYAYAARAIWPGLFTGKFEQETYNDESMGDVIEAVLGYHHIAKWAHLEFASDAEVLDMWRRTEPTLHRMMPNFHNAHMLFDVAFYGLTRTAHVKTSVARAIISDEERAAHARTLRDSPHAWCNDTALECD